MFKKHIPTRAALKDFVSFELLQELRRVIAGSTKMDDIATRISLMQTRAANSQDSRTLLQEAQVYGVATLGATYDLKNRIELAMENSNRSSAN
jgi:hypothetical protein